MKTTQNYQIPIKELFKILELDGIEYNVPVVSKHCIKIDSPTGYAPVNGFVKKRHTVATYVFDNDTELKCSVEHLVFSNGSPKKISKCDVVDTINGSASIVGVLAGDEQDVYDVALDAPHQYVTPNGVIHHNTTLAKLLLTELSVQDVDVLEINASRTNGINDVRDRILNFIQMIPFGDFKVVLLDECLDENTLVSIKRYDKEIMVPIKDINDLDDLVKSFNVAKNRIEWKSFDLFNKGTQETLEIEFENNEVVICTPDHKWYVEDEHGESIVIKASELSRYNHILTT